MELHYLELLELSGLLRRREVTSVEATRSECANYFAHAGYASK
jgi:hypothetical protein